LEGKGIVTTAGQALASPQGHSPGCW